MQAPHARAPGSSPSASARPPPRTTLSTMISAARPQELERQLEVLRRARLVGVDEDQIERPAPSSIERAAAHRAPARRAARRALRARARSMFGGGDLGVVGIELQRDQAPAGRQRPRQPDRAVAAERAELEDRSRHRGCAPAGAAACPAPARPRSAAGPPRRSQQRRLEHRVVAHERVRDVLVDLVPALLAHRAPPRPRGGSSARAAPPAQPSARPSRSACRAAPPARGARVRRHHLDRAVDVLHEQRQPPELHRPLGPAVARDDLVGLLHELEDLARRGGRTPDAAPPRASAPRARGAGRGPPPRMRPRCARSAGDIATTWSISTTPFGCAGAGGRGGRRRDLSSAGRRARRCAASRSDQPTIPSPAPRPARRSVTPASSQAPSSTRSRAPPRTAGSSAMVISSIVGMLVCVHARRAVPGSRANAATTEGMNGSAPRSERAPAPRSAARAGRATLAARRRALRAARRS